MILNKYILKELFKAQFVVLIVLVGIFAGQSIVSLITDAAVGSVPPSLILQFLLISMPRFLIYLLPLTMYVAIIIALGRFCSDSEMIAMRAIGYSPKRLVLVTYIVAIVTAVVVGYVGLDLIQRAAQEQYDLEQKAANNPEFLPIESGRFVNFGNYDIYIEDVKNNDKDNKQINNIFVIEDKSGNASITAAREGHLEVDENGVKWLVLNDGRRYDFIPEGYRRAQFENFRAPVSGNVTEDNRTDSDINRKTTLELLSSTNKRELVEVQWRVAPIFACLVLCLVAVPLSMVNPRQGRFARLMPAILIYVAYYLFLLSIRNLVITDKFPLYPGLYIVPVVFLLVVAIPLNIPKSQLKHMRTNAKLKRSIIKSYAEEAEQRAAAAALAKANAQPSDSATASADVANAAARTDTSATAKSDDAQSSHASHDAVDDGKKEVLKDETSPNDKA